MNQRDFRNKLATITVFIIAILYLLLQFRNVMVYFDDYAYYSLIYGLGSKGAHIGNTFNLTQLLEYLYLHYFNWNGRILYYFVWLSLYILGGIPLVQTMASILVVTVLMLLWKFASDSRQSSIVAICICALYGLFPTSLHRNGTYWMSAFFHYIAPLVPLFSFLLLYFKDREHTIAKKGILIILVFMAAFSQEQLAVAVTFMTCILLLFKIKQASVEISDWILVLTATFGMLILLFCPGLERRMNTHNEISFERIYNSTYQVIKMFFSDEMGIFICLLFGTLLTVCFFWFRKDCGWKKYLDTVGILIALLTMFSFCCDVGINITKTIFTNKILTIIIGTSFVSILVFQVVRYYWECHKISHLVVFLTAVISVACLCVVPELPFRLMLPTWFLLFPLLIDGIFLSANLIKEKNKFVSSLFLTGICVAIVGMSITTCANIYIGYACNATVHRYNDAILKDVAVKEARGQLTDEIYLKKIPKAVYGGVLTYDNGTTYITKWIKNYYGITSEASLFFSEDGTATLPDGQEFVQLDECLWVNKESVIVSNVFYTHTEKSTVQIGVECNPIYSDCQIEINGIIYPTIRGKTFISTEIDEMLLDTEETNYIAVVVPSINLRSAKMELDIND